MTEVSPRQALMIRALMIYKETRGPVPDKIKTFRGMWKWIAEEFNITLPVKNRSVYCNNLLKEFVQSKGYIKNHRNREHWLWPEMKDTYKCRTVKL